MAETKSPRGGTHQQHVEAGKQSHKNSPVKEGTGRATSHQAKARDSHTQHVEAGRKGGEAASKKR